MERGSASDHRPHDEHGVLVVGAHVTALDAVAGRRTRRDARSHDPTSAGSSWTRIVIDLNLETRQYLFTVDGIAGTPGQVDPGFVPRALVIGASFVLKCQLPWEVLFDDLEVTITP